jgi:hypothetical protein
MFSFKFWYTHLYRTFIRFRMEKLFFLVHLLFYINSNLLVFVQMSLIKYHVVVYLLLHASTTTTTTKPFCPKHVGVG